MSSIRAVFQAGVSVALLSLRYYMEDNNSVLALNPSHLNDVKGGEADDTRSQRYPASSFECYGYCEVALNHPDFSKYSKVLYIDPLCQNDQTCEKLCKKSNAFLVGDAAPGNIQLLGVPKSCIKHMQNSGSPAQGWSVVFGTPTATTTVAHSTTPGSSPIRTTTTQSCTQVIESNSDVVYRQSTYDNGVILGESAVLKWYNPVGVEMDKGRHFGGHCNSDTTPTFALDTHYLNEEDEKMSKMAGKFRVWNGCVATFTVYFNSCDPVPATTTSTPVTPTTTSASTTTTWPFTQTIDESQFVKVDGSDPQQYVAPFNPKAGFYPFNPKAVCKTDQACQTACANTQEFDNLMLSLKSDWTTGKKIWVVSATIGCWKQLKRGQKQVVMDLAPLTTTSTTTPLVCDPKTGVVIISKERLRVLQSSRHNSDIRSTDVFPFANPLSIELYKPDSEASKKCPNFFELKTGQVMTGSQPAAGKPQFGFIDAWNGCDADFKVTFKECTCLTQVDSYGNCLQN